MVEFCVRWRWRWRLEAVKRDLGLLRVLELPDALEMLASDITRGAEAGVSLKAAVSTGSTVRKKAERTFCESPLFQPACDRMMPSDFFMSSYGSSPASAS